MAVKDSNEIATNSNYALGDYSFRIERSSVPGSTNDKIEAICTDKDGKNARKSIQVPSSTEMLGWYVEANETEATVYAVCKNKEGEPWQQIDVPHSSGNVAWVHDGMPSVFYGCNVAFIYSGSGEYADYILADSTQKTVVEKYENGRTFYHYLGSSATYDGKTVFFFSTFFGGAPTSVFPTVYDNKDHLSYQQIAWLITYGGDYKEDVVDQLIGRFAIDLEDAGGVGPGSDWDDPGDYDPDWEEGDPTHTLYVTVTGALSGRHNDPIEDPSYSYIPADKDTVKDYGCGGDGGHGGGGGAGASTVVVHKFATNQANSKEVTAIARRHGYGSGGGKGGKGGDGCILVYY